MLKLPRPWRFVMATLENEYKSHEGLPWRPDSQGSELSVQWAWVSLVRELDPTCGNSKKKILHAVNKTQCSQQQKPTNQTKNLMRDPGSEPPI